MAIDVLCVGHASYDLIYSIPHHPDADEKMVADHFISCGGGPAANASVQVAKLGLKAAFAGYLGNDLYGDKHNQELFEHGVNVDKVIRGASPTPLSTILVKPDGNRGLINYKGKTKPLPANAIDFSNINAKVILFDGHEPQLSLLLAKQAKRQGIPTVLDAGSVHEGTLALLELVDYPVCSEKFAVQWAGATDTALSRLANISPYVVITMSERGLIASHKGNRCSLSAFPITAVDSTGAGDAFHGAFAAALALGQEWDNILRYASAAGALCCTKAGARLGLPNYQEHNDLFKRGPDLERNT
jgi:sulfofructose kinase